MALTNIHDCEIIQVFKTIVQKCPHPTEYPKKFYNFKAIFYYLQLWLKNHDTRLKDMSNYYLEMLWTQLVDVYMQPVWHTESVGSRYRPYEGVTVSSLKDLLKIAIARNDLRSFFEAFPYVENLLVIDAFLNASSPEEALTELFDQIVKYYSDILKNYDSIHPILVLREMVKLILNRNDFDELFYKKYMKSAEQHLQMREKKPYYDWIQLSLFVSTNVSHYLRRTKGFKKLDWDALAGLHRRVEKDKKAISETQSQRIAEGLELYLEDLILFEMGQLSKENEIRLVDLRDLATINAQENIEPAFRVIVEYSSIIYRIKKDIDDNDTSRLATLRAISAFGEAVTSIMCLLPEETQESLEVLIDIKDHIVHAATLDAFKYIEDIIYDLENQKILTHCLIELQELKPFFADLKIWVDKNEESANNLTCCCFETAKFPTMPALTNLNLLKEKFVEIKSNNNMPENISNPTQHINSNKRCLINECEHTIETSNRLRQKIHDYTLTIRDDDKEFKPVVSAACEMLYGIVVERFKQIKRYLRFLDDYQDVTLYVFMSSHRIEKLYTLIEKAINVRNDVFRFNELQREATSKASNVPENQRPEPIDSVTFLRNHWIKTIMNDPTYHEIQSLKVLLKK